MFWFIAIGFVIWLCYGIVEARPVSRDTTPEEDEQSDKVLYVLFILIGAPIALLLWFGLIGIVLAALWIAINIWYKNKGWNLVVPFAISYCLMLHYFTEIM